MDEVIRKEFDALFEKYRGLHWTEDVLFDLFKTGYLIGKEVVVDEEKKRIASAAGRVFQEYYKLKTKPRSEDDGE